MPAVIKRSRSAVFCPMCGTIMVRGRQTRGVRMDEAGRTIEVVYANFMCPFEQCKTPVRLWYRTDGEEGDLHKQLAYERKIGKKLITDFGGTFGELR